MTKEELISRTLELHEMLHQKTKEKGWTQLDILALSTMHSEQLVSKKFMKDGSIDIASLRRYFVQMGEFTADSMDANVSEKESLEKMDEDILELYMGVLMKVIESEKLEIF